MRQFEWARTSGDGIRLHMQSWEPDDAPRAAVVLVHGFGEHSGRYRHVARALTGAGYAVLSGDNRGHGKSGGLRGHTPSYEHIMDDVGALVQAWALAPASVQIDENAARAARVSREVVISVSTWLGTMVCWQWRVGGAGRCAADAIRSDFGIGSHGMHCRLRAAPAPLTAAANRGARPWVEARRLQRARKADNPSAVVDGWSSTTTEKPTKKSN